MMSISSAAGKRLAKARHEVLTLVQREGVTDAEIGAAMWEMGEAANAVADELVEQRFHEFEGD